MTSAILPGDPGVAELHIDHRAGIDWPSGKDAGVAELHIDKRAGIDWPSGKDAELHIDNRAAICRLVFR